MPESERVYKVLDRIERTQNENHTEVVQRLAKLEANQHSPSDCPGVHRVEKRMDKEDDEKRDESWKGYAKEGLRLVSAIGTSIGTVFALK